MRRSLFPLGREAGRRAQDVRFAAERHQRAFGFRHQGGEPRVRALDAEQGDQRRLAGGGVLAGGLAERRRIALDVEQIVGDLEGLADRRAIAIERGAPWRPLPAVTAADLLARAAAAR